MTPTGELSESREEPPSDVLPTFDLDYGFDDPDDPVEVTIYAPDVDAITTTWLSIDASHAVPLEDVA